MKWLGRLATKIKKAHPSRKKGEMIHHPSDQATNLKSTAKPLPAAGPLKGATSLASKAGTALKGAGWAPGR